jgi:hypothetical protein
MCHSMLHCVLDMCHMRRRMQVSYEEEDACVTRCFTAYLT